MSDFGIICEVNPLHGGHEYLLKQARQLGADRVVCIMSGNTVQRGELAVADAYLRAEALVECGADLVLELPFPWCSGSAEAFSRGGIAILRHFADTVLFGSECGNVEILKKGAEAALVPAFREGYRARLTEGRPAARTYYDMLREATDTELSSNDLLGVEYIRSAMEQQTALQFKTVQRMGAGYDELQLTEGEYPSARGIRALWAKGEWEKGQYCLPKQAATVYGRGKEEGRILDQAKEKQALLTFFRLCDVQELEQRLQDNSGLLRHICSCAAQAESGEDFFARIRTKRYTDAHLHRAMLHGVCGVKPQDLKDLPAYTTLLATNEIGRKWLAEKRKDEKLPVITKPADAPKQTRQYELSGRVDTLFSLCTEQIRPISFSAKQMPYVKTEENRT